MISSDLLQFICSVRDQLVRDIFQTEAAVREMIVLPVLGHLGWPLNPLHIRPEHSLGIVLPVLGSKSRLWSHDLRE